MKRLHFIFVLVLLVVPVSLFAHAPVIEDAGVPSTLVPEAEVLADPTVQSLAVYGALDRPGEVDIYTFTAQNDGEIPFEALVPKKNRLENFRPYLAVYGKDFPSEEEMVSPWESPDDYIPVIIAPKIGVREIFNEPFSQEKYYSQTERNIQVKDGERYFLAVYDPTGDVGEYVLGLGTVENFENANFGELITSVAKVKLNLVGGREVPWLETLGLFLFMAGFIIGLGAVTVIDLHGFMGRKSGYWTEATIRTHKITKPLIWLGTFMAAIGGFITYWGSGLSGTAFFHAILLITLVLNGLFLTFSVSPMLLKLEKEDKADKVLPKKWQRAITISFVVSFFGWWGSAFLLIWYLVMVR